MKKNKAVAMAEPYIIDRILSYLKPYALSAKVLDIASGQGYVLERLSQLGFQQLTAADINAKNFRLDKKEFHFTKVDANNTLPFSNATFDIIISSETIEHLENPRQFLREIARILKPKGQFILTTPTVDSIISRLYFLFTGNLAFHTKADYDVSGHIAVLPNWLIERFCEKAGFSLQAKAYSSCYLPIIKVRLTHPLFLNGLLGWITIYRFTKKGV